MIYVFLGGPGAGKGTRAKYVCQAKKIPHISTGSLIRESVQIFEKYKSMMGDGKLLPDEAIKEMLEERLKKDDAKNGFILDGYPRTVEQIHDLEDLLNEFNKKITKVFLFDATDEELYNRLANRKICAFCDRTYGSINGSKVPNYCEKCGRELTVRHDDKPETVKNRLAIYHEQIDPIVEYYEKAGLLERIDATDAPEKILESV